MSRGHRGWLWVATGVGLLALAAWGVPWALHKKAAVAAERATRRAILADDWPAAGKAALAWTKAAPNDPVPFWVLGYAKLVTDDDNGAGRALSHLKRYLDAPRLRKWAAECAKEQPRSVAASLLCASALNYGREPKDAIAALDRALVLHPESALAYVGRGSYKAVIRDWQGALRDLDRAIVLRPTYAEAYFERGVVHHRAGDYPLAVTDFNRAVQFNSKFGEAYYYRSLAFWRQGQKARYEADLQRSISLGCADGYASRAYGKAGRDDYRQAISDLDAALRIEPNRSSLYRYRGSVHSQADERRAAFADFSRAIELNPLDPLTYGYRGDAHERLKRYNSRSRTTRRPSTWTRRTPGGSDDAASSIGTRRTTRVQFRISPDRSPSSRRPGPTKTARDAYDDQGDRVCALEDYASALRLNPRDTYAYCNRAITLTRLHRYAEALSDVNRALALDPNYADAYRERGIDRYEQGDYSAALADLNHAISLAPDEPLPYKYKALALSRLGRTAEAEAAERKRQDVRVRNLAQDLLRRLP